MVNLQVTSCNRCVNVRLLNDTWIVKILNDDLKVGNFIKNFKIEKVVKITNIYRIVEKHRTVVITAGVHVNYQQK